MALRGQRETSIYSIHTLRSNGSPEKAAVLFRPHPARGPHYRVKCRRAITVVGLRFRCRAHCSRIINDYIGSKRFLRLQVSSTATGPNAP